MNERMKLFVINSQFFGIFEMFLIVRLLF